MDMIELSAPSAVHIGEDSMPWADTGTGVKLKVLQVREQEGLWVIRNQFDPGVEVQTHRHTGPVFGVTFAGAWGYRESPDLNRAGSFLYEPANSVHTLYVPEENTEVTDVLFVMYGMNINLRPDGTPESVTSGPDVLAAYYLLLDHMGIARPEVLTD